MFALTVGRKAAHKIVSYLYESSDEEILRLARELDQAQLEAGDDEQGELEITVHGEPLED